MIRLQQQPVRNVEIIALAEHVDYWNMLGWSDPFSSAQFSDRQNWYASGFRTGRVYTPQMIVDGKTEFVGSEWNRALQAVRTASARPKAAIDLRRQDGRLSITVPRLPAGLVSGALDLVLAITEDHLATRVPRGENAGKTLSHVGVVRHLKTLAQVQPGQGLAREVALEFAKEWKRENLRAVVFLQERSSHSVVGAAGIRLSQ